MGLQQAAAQQLLRLCSFSSNMVYTPASLAALPHDTITDLEFYITNNSPSPWHMLHHWVEVSAPGVQV